MRFARWILMLVSAVAAHAAIVAADSTRGEGLFESQGCVQCHSVNGNGGRIGPDLSRRVDRNYTPATLAGLMWNHAPAMWSAMRERGVLPGGLNQQAAADLFAYFCSVRFFEKPGDAARGKRLFTERHCAECHGLTGASPSGAKRTGNWTSLDSPIALANAMWNHAADMSQKMVTRRIGWFRLNAQDLTDILVYLRNLPSPQQMPVVFRTTTGEGGKELFVSMGCSGCHTELALSRKLKGNSLTGIAAEMWNHEPRMAAAQAEVPHLRLEQTTALVSYLWADFLDSGNAAHGKRVFAAKKCTVCHDDRATGAPVLSHETGSFSGTAMVAALWHHGPAMLDKFQEKNLRWPRFDGDEMADLIAYLNSR